MVKFGNKKTAKKGGGKGAPERPPTIQDPNFNGDGGDFVATGKAEMAAAQIREAMKGANPKGSTTHNAA